MFQEKVQKRLELLDVGSNPSQFVEISDKEFHLLEAGTGKADLQLILNSPSVLFKFLEKKGLPYFKNKKCADYVLFENMNDEWFVHIFELKRTVASDRWQHIKLQFSGALQNAYALAGVLGIKIDLDKVKAYTVYRNDKLNDASNPVKLRYGINTKGDSTGSLEQKEWNSDTVEIDFTEKVILEHCKVQLDIETGAGQCRLA